MNAEVWFMSSDRRAENSVRVDREASPRFVRVFLGLHMDTGTSQLWRERVLQETGASLRASPVTSTFASTPRPSKSTREARLRREIDLALQEAAMKARAKHQTMRETEKAALGQLSHRSSHTHTSRRHNEPAPPPSKPLSGSQVALPVSAAGSLSSRLLKERGVQFKNMESDAWGF